MTIKSKLSKTLFTIISLLAIASSNLIPANVAYARIDSIDKRQASQPKIKKKHLTKTKKKKRAAKKLQIVNYSSTSCLIPDVDEFNADIRERYSLFGTRWDKYTITYNTGNLDAKSIKLTDDIVQAINELNFVTLIKTNDESTADITINKGYIGRSDILGNTECKLKPDYYKGLRVISKADIILNWDEIKHSKCSQSVYAKIIAHELGHALGLGHIMTNSQHTMSEHVIINEDPEFVVDDSFITSLKVLYFN